jgi:hypothetical protein
MIEDKVFVDTIVHTMRDKPEAWDISSSGVAGCGDTRIWSNKHNQKAYVWRPDEIRMEESQERRLYNEIRQLKIRQAERRIVEVYAEKGNSFVLMSAAVIVSILSMASCAAYLASTLPGWSF